MARSLAPAFAFQSRVEAELVPEAHGLLGGQNGYTLTGQPFLAGAFPELLQELGLCMCLLGTEPSLHPWPWPCPLHTQNLLGPPGEVFFPFLSAKPSPPASRPPCREGGFCPPVFSPHREHAYCLRITTAGSSKPRTHAWDRCSHVLPSLSTTFSPSVPLGSPPRVAGHP